MSAPGLMLIFTVGGRGPDRPVHLRPRRGQDALTGDVALSRLLDAMAEPAALVWATGQVLAFNGAWAEAGGATAALPPARSGGKSGAALYMAFAQARAGEQGRAIVPVWASASLRS
jgi:two-component system cell cycle sensor histidine kinase/response regulator CckA